MRYDAPEMFLVGIQAKCPVCDESVIVKDAHPIWTEFLVNLDASQIVYEINCLLAFDVVHEALNRHVEQEHPGMPFEFRRWDRYGDPI